MVRPAQQLVGRASELAALEEAIARLQRRRPGALELCGEPGIGKTRLLAELAAMAEDRGLLVLSGSASELEGDLPFWVFVDALDEYVQGLEPHRLAGLDAETRAELPNVLPSLEGAGAAVPVERYRTHRAVRALLDALAADTPLVLLLDDLHWADSGSVELLGALLRRPPSAPVLLAMAARPRQFPGGSPARSSARGRPARSPSSACTRSPASSRASCSARTSAPPRPRACTSRAAATRSTCSSSRARPRRPWPRR